MTTARLVRDCFLSLAFWSVIASTAGAQKTQAWLLYNQSQTYPGGIDVDATGAIYAAQTHANTTRVTKLAPDGSTLWSTDYVDPAGLDNEAAGIALDTDGSSYIVCYLNHVHSSPGVPGSSDIGLMKFDASGTFAWARAVTAGYGFQVLLDHAGSVYVSGEGLGGNLVEIAKYSTAGQQQWSTTIPVSLIGYKATTVLSGPYLYVGASTQPTTASDWFVTRIDTTTGAILWFQDIDGGFIGADALNGIAVNAAGEVVVGGSFDSGTSTGTAMTVKMLDPSGNTLWTWMGPYVAGGSGVSQVQFDPNGRIVCAGYEPSPTGVGMSLLTLDHAGNLVWQRSFLVGTDQDKVDSLIVEPSGDITFVGAVSTDLTLYPSFEAFAYGFDSAGNQKWSFTQPDVPVTNLFTQFTNVKIMPGQSVLLEVFTTVPYLHGELQRLDQEAVAFCFGDGSGSACPCGNASAPSEQAGCASSLGVGGKLASSGLSEIGSDSLTLLGTNMPNAGTLYFQGTTEALGGSGSVFGDGLRCAGGTMTRLGTKTNANGASQYPGMGNATVSVRGGVTSPGTRTYQAWYRNAASFCTSSTFNLTNGLLVTWSP